jgi:hypothetical protein
VLLHPLHTTANTPRAAAPRRAFHLTCRAYQALLPAVNSVPRFHSPDERQLTLESVRPHVTTIRQRSPELRHSFAVAARLRLMDDTARRLQRRGQWSISSAHTINRTERAERSVGPGRAAARHWLLPQEAAYRRWAARLLARRTASNSQRTAFEKMYGPDGVVYFEAAVGEMVGAAVALIGGVVVLANGLPYQVASWLFVVLALSGLIALVRFRQALKAGKAFRGGKPIIRFRRRGDQG